MPDYQSPLSRFLHLVRSNDTNTYKQFSRLAALTVKLLPAGAMQRLEGWQKGRALRRFKHPHPPVYLLGHWRSGTSFLHFLLGEDPQFTYHTKFQTLFPNSFLVTEKTVKPLAEQLMHSFKAFRNWKNGISLNMALDSPSEIEISLLNQGQYESFHWGHFFPTSWKWYFDRYLFQETITEKERRRWRHHILNLNLKVNFQHPDKRLLVKNPGDTARVSEILNLYPNAKFIFIHRNPYDVFYSNKKLWNNLMRNFALEVVSQREIDRAILYTYRKMHENYVRDRKAIPQKNLIEISHNELKERPHATLEKIYAHLRLPGYAKAEPHFRHFLNKRQPGQIHQYDYRREDIEAINQAWHLAFEAWDYEMQQTDVQTP